MGFISNGEWLDYKNIIDEFMIQDAADKSILWRRYIWGTDRYMEDTEGEHDNTVELKCLINYNVFRTWPVTYTTETGELDKESIQVFFNKEYLKSLGYITIDGNFNFNPDDDRFFVDGKPYKAMGDTAAAQAKSNDLVITIILKREKLATGQPYSP